MGLRQALLRWGCVFLCLLFAPRKAPAEGVRIVVSDPGGASGRAGAPVAVTVDLEKLFGPEVRPGHLRLRELSGAPEACGPEIPVQFEPAPAGGSLRGTLWWLLGPGAAEERRFALTQADTDSAAALSIAEKKYDATGGTYFDMAQDGSAVLRYNHGTVPVPGGIPPEYARGDYLSPLFGPEGEVLTADYPKDHPHHRGVGWSWPVTRWKEEVRDIWAVSGVWSRPVAVRRVACGPVYAVVSVENVWKWGDTTPIVREDVVIRAFRSSPGAKGRFVDLEVRLEGIEDGVAIGGRPHAGYGGFGLRGAPAGDRKITLHTDPLESSPRSSWLDYSGVFAGAKGRSGVTILEHPENLGFPNQLQQYPDCDYVMPACPGDREVPLPKGKTLVLRHRLWVHSGDGVEAALRDVWTAYAKPPGARLAAVAKPKLDRVIVVFKTHFDIGFTTRRRAGS